MKIDVFSFLGPVYRNRGFKTLGGFLNESRSRWVNALVNVDAKSSGTAESFLNVSHKIKAASLYVLQQSAYKTIWKLCHQHQRQACKMGSIHPQFFFWTQLLELNFHLRNSEIN